MLIASFGARSDWKNGRNFREFDNDGTGLNGVIMNFITKPALPRRTFLRPVAATLALPLLEAMMPAATPLAKTAANPVRRLGFVFMPMGCDITRWTPRGGHRLEELSPILSSLA